MNATQVEQHCPPAYPQDIVDFFHIPVYKNPTVLHAKYVVEGLSIAQIAKEFLSSKEAVRQGLIKAGIPVREKSKPHGRTAQLKFGKRLQADKEVDFKAEQRVIEMVVGMKAEGLGLRAIARCLTQMKIPTKCQGRSWHPEMVKRVLQGNPQNDDKVLT